MMNEYAIPELPGGDYTGAFPLTQAMRRGAPVPKTVTQTSLDQGGSVLPMARAASRTTDPYDTTDLQQRTREMLVEQQKLQAEPDYSQQQQYMRDRSSTYLPQALSATLLGMGPQATQGIAKLAAQGVNDLSNPMKIEGGFIDANGSVQLDPGYQREKKVAALRDDIRQTQALIASTQDKSVQRALQERAAESNEMLRMMMIQGQQDSRRMTYQLGMMRAGDARSAAADRAERAAEKAAQLNPAQVKTLTEAQGAVDKFRELRDTWKASHSGPGTDFGNLWGKFSPLASDASREQATWWQGYQNFVNGVRHEQFGAALTVPEKSEFEKAIITPGTDPRVAKIFLDKQVRLAEEGYARTVNAMSRSGRDTSEFAAPRNNDRRAPPAAGGGAPPGGSGRTVNFSDLPNGR